MVKLGITGDVMLGRLVDEYIFGDQARNPAYIWGNTLKLFQNVDLRLINLECVISSKGKPWTKTPKVFHFRARPKAIEALKMAKIDYVSLANNHSFDFGKDALLECLEILRKAGIAFSGAGQNVSRASQSRILNIGNWKLGIISLTDNEPAWEAKENSAGINFVAYDKNGLQEPYFSRINESIAKTKKNVDFVIVSAHIGPNWGKPSREIQAVAHQLIDFGADIYWGHSNHTVQGIEIYKGKPILYSCGDFIDDYAVDPLERNDFSFFFEVHLGKVHNFRDLRNYGRLGVEKIVLHPVKIENLQVNIAAPHEAGLLLERMILLCAELATKTERKNKELVINFKKTK